MSCFWNGILSKLNHEDYVSINISPPINIKGLLDIFQTHIKILDDVIWQNELLSTKNKTEIIRDIKSYDYKSMNMGHLTSSCDPFLCAVCQLFKLDIVFNYNGNIIKFNNKLGSRRTLNFSASTAHFS